ncbi:hypothetical protein NCCP2222_09670 [Sporosarcina sp. NCCP-2222]|uniref:DUF5412 domain-containing protein n=1 Tax=Sporosarcina sp. NCCP-2222 TaxID=2935073 RepID=UPI002086B4BD|nr:DUF5412 domain-containing protein [Sporosarcina sp. NCCP-2222]GKV55020.1 hypothetical protein NCCP2222_09670 [Sporosarcina sp. NCCP-2222]
MKKRSTIIITIFIPLLIFAVVLSIIWYQFFYNTQRLPEGVFLTESSSPGGDYTVTAYLVDGGATVSYAVRAEVVYHRKKDKKKNIYWQYREDEASIEWLDSHTVRINGHKLDVRRDVYDWRKD